MKNGLQFSKNFYKQDARITFDDVVINKIQSIQRCILRVREEYRLAGTTFAQNFSHQDAALLNLTRACEHAIDLANHIIKTHHFGIPTNSRDSFSLLANQSVISPTLCSKLQNMVSFRNIAIHEYQSLNLNIVVAIIETSLDDLFAFNQAVMKFSNKS